ncbi:MAG: NADH-dependent oxidoreductase, partial [Planctomycetaceae bacterium]|nr:NADH-dependent oxidoreductase [Planctomycetaceae bacterium]
CGMMGEVVGKAASICVKHECLPRDVYERYWPELDSMLKLPGKAFRATVRDDFTIPADALPEAGPYGAPSGLDPKKLPGLVLDDRDATKSAGWTEGSGLKGYIGYGYLYAGQASAATCEWTLKVPKSGNYEVRVAYQPHENRGSRVPVTVKTTAGAKTTTVDMRQPAPLEHGFITVNSGKLLQGETVTVTISSKDCGGNAHADAVQLIEVK